MKTYDKKEMLILAASTTLGLGMRFLRAKKRPHKLVKELNQSPARFAAGFSALAAVAAISVAANQVSPKDEKTVSPAEAVAGLAASSLSMAINYKVTAHLMKDQEKLSTPHVVAYTALGLLTPTLSYVFKKGLGVITEKMAVVLKDQALTEAEKLAKDLENAYKEYVPNEEDIAVSEALKSRRAAHDAKIDVVPEVSTTETESDNETTSTENNEGTSMSLADEFMKALGVSDEGMSEEERAKMDADLAFVNAKLATYNGADYNILDEAKDPAVKAQFDHLLDSINTFHARGTDASEDDIISDVVDEHIKSEDDSTDDSKKD